MKEIIQNISPDKLIPFKDHPYQVREDTSMDELMESIRNYGILTPILARPVREEYELVSGHRRRLAALKLGLTAVPVLVRDMTDDEATILMVDSNLQRENLLPSEKAFAYKMKLEALKHQGKVALDQVGPKWSSLEIAKESNTSMTQVKRYIRLTNLAPPLLKLVDDGYMAFSPAVEVSYLTKEEQAELWAMIIQEEATPSVPQAIRLKKLSWELKLTHEVIHAILTEEKPNQKDQVCIRIEALRKFFPPNYSAKQMEREILKLLEAQQKARYREDVR